MSDLELFITLLILIVGGTFCMFYFFINEEYIGVLVGFLLLIGAFAMLVVLNEGNNFKDELEKIKDNSDEITFYLDGTEVEYESINLDLYKWIYDAEKKVVHMTKE